MNKEEIKKLYLSGMEIKNIAELFNSDYKTIWRILKKLDVKIVRKVKELDHNFFENFTIESCYWAGFIAADGCVSDKGLFITLWKNDIHHIGLFRKNIKSNTEISENVKTQKSGKVTENCGISLYSPKIVKDLFINFNIVRNKSKIIEPPLKIPNDLIKHYIRGYFDGDGSISWHKHNNTPRIEFATGSKNLIKWIKLILEENIEILGRPKILIDNKWGIYKLDYMGKQIVEVMKWLYEGSNEEIRLKRKYKRYTDYEKKVNEKELKIKSKNNEIIKRNEKIIKLRGMGLTLLNIAERLNICQATCCKIIKLMERNDVS